VTATLALPPDATSPRRARRFVTDCLGSIDGAPLDVATLLVSELVTNAVLHAHTTIAVTVTPSATSVRVGVRDQSPALPAVRHYERTAPTGRGLQMVEALAAQWGVSVDDGSKTVWFELELLDDAEAGRSDAWAGRTRPRPPGTRATRPPRSSIRRSRGHPEASLR
jgi:hypothetical protein